MYGMQGKFIAQPGKRDEFIKILLRAADLVGRLPECHLYIVGKDLNDENVIVITEIWDDKASHDTSLQNETVRALIGKATPLMNSTPKSIEFTMAGGYGLPKT